jgi:hypothetical protein
MRKTTPLFVLLGFQALFAALGLLFHQVVRPSLLLAYAQAGMGLRSSESLALSPWLLPTITLLGLLVSGSGFLPNIKSARRLRRVATGLTMQALLAVVAALIGLLPMLRG